jgi:prostaglandin-endoperoxide synthase 2
MVVGVTRGFWRKNGVKNGVRIRFTTGFPTLWDYVNSRPRLRSVVNKWLINSMIDALPPRPLGMSTYSDYRSWPALADRSWSARHLGPDPALQERLPKLSSVVELFERTEIGDQPSPKSTLLFPHFAQWFVDGFLRTDPSDCRKNTSTHDIDLSQLYGQTVAVTRMLRECSETERGRLKCQRRDGREFPPYYFDENGTVKKEFEKLEIVFPGSDKIQNLPGEDRKTGVPIKKFEDWQRNKLFALGIPRGNIHYGLMMMSTLFLREHNRIAGLIAADNPGWNDDRVFETTRNTLTVIMLKVVIEDYINHITPIRFKFFVEPGVGVKEKWYQQNWMSVEFNLLYRWHTMIPSQVRLAGEMRNIDDVMFDTDVVINTGLAALFDEASKQQCNAVGLFNTDPCLISTEEKTIEIGRKTELASFNAYRQLCGYPKLKTFPDISSTPEVQSALQRCYGDDTDNVELYVGLFAEDVRENGILPTLMATMVAVDAFSQALTNPLLGPTNYNAKTFSEAGMHEIERTTTLNDIVQRNVSGELPKSPLVSFTQKGWSPR